MRKNRKHWGVFVGLALMGLAALLSFSQLAVSAEAAIAAACEGLTCTAQEDCGSKCFCNRPSQTCYLDSVPQ